MNGLRSLSSRLADKFCKNNDGHNEDKEREQQKLAMHDKPLFTYNDTMGDIQLICKDIFTTDTYGAFTTDNAISFFLRVLQQETVIVNKLENVLIYDVLFFTGLMDKDIGPSVLIKSRRLKHKLFKADFVVWPVVHNFHWVLIVLGHANQPNAFIAIFDSFSRTDVKSPLLTQLRTYLTLAWKTAKMSFVPLFDQIPVLIPNVPQQHRMSNDCGLFMVEFLVRFLYEPLDVVSRLFAGQLVNWFTDDTRVITRARVVNCMLDKMPDSEKKESICKLIYPERSISQSRKRSASLVPSSDSGYDTLSSSSKAITNGSTSDVDHIESIEQDVVSGVSSVGSLLQQTKFDEPEADGDGYYKVFSFHSAKMKRGEITAVKTEFLGWEGTYMIPIDNITTDMPLFKRFKAWYFSKPRLPSKRPTVNNMGTGCSGRQCLAFKRRRYDCFTSTVVVIAGAFIDNNEYNREYGFFNMVDEERCSLVVENDFITQIFDSFAGMSSTSFRLHPFPIGNHTVQPQLLKKLLANGVYDDQYNTRKARSAVLDMVKLARKGLPVLGFIITPNGIVDSSHSYVCRVSLANNSKPAISLWEPTLKDIGTRILPLPVREMCDQARVCYDSVDRKYGDQGETTSDCIERSLSFIAELMDGTFLWPQ